MTDFSFITKGEICFFTMVSHSLGNEFFLL